MRSERGHSAAPCIFTTIAEVLGREAGIAECPGWAIEAHRPSPGILLRLPGRFCMLISEAGFLSLTEGQIQLPWSQMKAIKILI